MAQPWIETWKRHTTPFERVRSVVLSLRKPRTVKHISDAAAVSTDTAEKHLSMLVETGTVVEYKETNPHLYEPDESHVRSDTVRDLLTNHDSAELVEIRDELRARVNSFRDDYDVDSPRGLEEPNSIAREWELIEYRLELLTEVIEDQ